MTSDQWYRLLYPVVRFGVTIAYPVKVHGRENIPEGGGLVCANHYSALDPIFVAFALTGKRPIRPIAKESLLKIPVIGYLLKLIGCIGVKRGASDIAAVKIALEQLNNHGYVVIFPEGTRIRSREEGEPKTGAAMLATRTGVNVIPVYVPQKKRVFRLNHVYVGQPFKMIPAGRRATSAEYGVFTKQLMDKIYDAGDGK